MRDGLQKRWCARIAVLIACTLACRCHGPLTKPMVDRLDEKTQARVDDAWTIMFTPPDKVDRTLLLDVILSGQLHQFGVDYLRLVSEKYAGDGLVVMEIRFQRDDAASDEFSVTYLDSQGYEIRCERFTREDVQDRVDFLFSPIVVDETSPPEWREEMELLAAEREARQEEIQALLAPIFAEEDGAAEAPSE
jgi:hypothetical protein